MRAAQGRAEGAPGFSFHVHAKAAGGARSVRHVADAQRGDGVAAPWRAARPARSGEEIGALEHMPADGPDGLGHR
jgi:hypothetical protein